MSDTTCPYCEGSGREDDGEVCLACNGSGWYGTSKQLTDKIQSLEQEVARLKQENLATRNWKSCKHLSFSDKYHEFFCRKQCYEMNKLVLCASGRKKKNTTKR